MHIVAENLERKFRKEYIFQNFSYTFHSENSYAITGPNGSGKSTLMKILSTYSLPTKGSLKVFNETKELINPDHQHQYISFAAPYTQLIEEFTLEELIDFILPLNYIPNTYSIQKFEEFIELKPDRNKYIQNYSSGMRQKIKLGLALISNRPILLLDEPCTNLDRHAKNWFFKKLSENENKLIIIASNEEEEINFCKNQLSILDYK